MPALECQLLQLPLLQYQQQGALFFNVHLPPACDLFHRAIASQAKLGGFVHLADTDAGGSDRSHD